VLVRIQRCICFKSLTHDFRGHGRYPGCACDIPSASYQFTWERNPYWSQYYSESPEIWKYFKGVVDKHGLIKYVKLEHTVTGAYWQPEDGEWEVHVRQPDGTEFVDRCNVLVNGGGILKYVCLRPNRMPDRDADSGGLQQLEVA
jgi:cation diffusion facilitator CzcD-associated flavoprotein CzcO